MQDCIFCQIANHEMEAPVIAETSDFIVIPSKFPVAETHWLLIPKKHVQSIAHVGPDDRDLLGEIMLLASKTAAEKGISDYKLIFNAGKYTKVPHLHLHLLAGELEDNT